MNAAVWSVSAAACRSVWACGADAEVAVAVRAALPLVPCGARMRLADTRPDCSRNDDVPAPENVPGCGRRRGVFALLMAPFDDRSLHSRAGL